MGAAFPSLFLSPEEREEFLARIRSPRGRPIWQRLWSQARESLEEPLPADVREGAWAADARQVDRLGRLIELWSLAHFVTGEERFARRGTEALLALAALEHWVSDSHSHVRYDLMTGSISQELALGYDFLRNHLSEEEREALIARWEEKALRPYLEACRDPRNPYPYGHRTMNWVAVQTGGLGLALLAFGKADRDYARETEIARAHILRFLEWYHNDGSALEWGGYWVYGLGRALNFVAALERSGWPGLLSGRQDRKMARTGYFALYLSAGRLFVSAFGDTHLGPYDGAQPLLYFLARAHRDGVLQWWGDRMEGRSVWSLFYLDPGLEAHLPDQLPTCAVFSSPQLAVLRDRIQDEEDVVFSLRSGITRGPDQDAPHAHYDLQSILLHAFGRPLLVDSDARYSPEFWETYNSGTNPYTSTFAHNTILVDGQGQLYGENGEARIVEYDVAGEHPYARSELLRGYGPKLKRFARSVLFLERRAFLLYDQIDLAEPATVDWLLHIAGEAKGADGVTLTNGAASCVILAAASAARTLTQPGDHLVPYLKWSTQEKVSSLRVGTLLWPYRTAEAAPRGSVRLCPAGAEVTLGDRRYRWWSDTRCQSAR
jgi:hypothetical protein